MMGTGEKLKKRGRRPMPAARKSLVADAAISPLPTAQRLRSRLDNRWVRVRFMADQRVPLVTPWEM